MAPIHYSITKKTQYLLQSANWLLHTINLSSSTLPKLYIPTSCLVVVNISLEFLAFDEPTYIDPILASYHSYVNSNPYCSDFNPELFQVYCTTQACVCLIMGFHSNIGCHASRIQTHKKYGKLPLTLVFLSHYYLGGV